MATDEDGTTENPLDAIRARAEELGLEGEEHEDFVERRMNRAGFKKGPGEWIAHGDDDDDDKDDDDEPVTRKDIRRMERDRKRKSVAPPPKKTTENPPKTKKNNDPWW